MRSQPWVRWGLLAGLTAAGTAVMAALGVPSPALFAGLLVATALALAGLAPARIPRTATAAAQAVIGVVIGVLAQPGALAGLAADWLPVLLVMSGTLAISMAAGLLMGLWPGITPLTGMLALTAGGASGLVAVSRELGGDDRVVAVVQYLRVGIVTAMMPVLAAVAFGTAVTTPGDAPAGPPWYADLGFLLFCGVAGTALARLLRVPTAALLGPMTLAIALNLAGWSFGATPPTLVVEVAYAMIGWQAGARFTRESLRTVVGLLPFATALILAVIAACAGLGVLLSALTGATPLDGYLATTPGGVYAVVATAVSAGADVTFVVAVQVLRLIAMLLIAPVAARLVSRRGGGEATAAPP